MFSQYPRSARPSSDYRSRMPSRVSEPPGRQTSRRNGTTRTRRRIDECIILAQPIDQDQETALLYMRFEAWRRNSPPILPCIGGPRSVKARAELHTSHDHEYETIEVYEDHSRIMDTKWAKSHYKVHRVLDGGWLTDETSEFEKQSCDEGDRDGNRSMVGEVIWVCTGRAIVRRTEALATLALWARAAASTATRTPTCPCSRARSGSGSAGLLEDGAALP